jgi:1,2-diacylglycerol 3-beta-glucosyltransferase
MWDSAFLIPSIVSLLALCAVSVAFGYWLLLAVASLRPAERLRPLGRPRHTFAIAIPAHDEENVIGATVERFCSLDYPADMFAVHVVADHCSDGTAHAVRKAGGTAHERNDGPRTGKGAALSWLFERILKDEYDAVVVFDADTQVDADFLRVMDARLSSGARVVQGQHVISNPGDGWFPALAWSMFLVDNRYQNLGRANLHWSAKHMGDSICFRADVLRSIGWGEGLTDDFWLRQRLLLAGIHIEYEPAGIGRGEAPPTWRRAWTQRARWLQGTRAAKQAFGWSLLKEGLRRQDGSLLDGVLQARCPSYSTLTLITISALVSQALVNVLYGPTFAVSIIMAWVVLAGLLALYPFGALILESAPPKAYLAILLGPLFITWRACLAMSVRLKRRDGIWIRTLHGERT